MHQLHLILDSPARFRVTKTELDIGHISKPYEDIAQCIRAGFCISHNIRRWVRITIHFDHLEALAVTLDPQTIRFLGTDERSILHIILRAQEASQRSAKHRKVPHGVTIENLSAIETVSANTRNTSLVLLPGDKANWQDSIMKKTTFLMYCPLYEEAKLEPFTTFSRRVYHSYHRYDIAILEVLYTLETLGLVMEKD